LTGRHDLSASLFVKGTERSVANLRIMSSYRRNRLMRVRALKPRRRTGRTRTNSAPLHQSPARPKLGPPATREAESSTRRVGQAAARGLASARRVFAVADDPRDRSRPYVAAGVLFFDAAGRILLVQPTYKDYWDIPGGYVETGETPGCWSRGPRRARH
jgi:hypothetical protein